jgi:hypothetical protein
MMCSSRDFSRQHLRGRARRAGLVDSALVCAAAAAVLMACRGSSADAKKEGAAPSSEPERYNFALPSNYGKVELRGEGSETLRAPVGARVTRTAEGFSVEAGSDFALEVSADAPPLAELTGRVEGAGVARVVAEPDLAVFKSAQGYSFVVVRELVPEWDESQRQRFACTGAGGVPAGSPGAAPRVFPKVAMENMVAACRTMELPPLE